MIMQNLSRLLDDPRRRSIILITLSLLLTIVLVGGIRLFRQIRQPALPGLARIESMRPIRSVPGKVKKLPSQAYAKLQMEQNRQLAQEAKRTGGSAIATIVDSFDIDDEKADFNKRPPPAFLSETDRTIAHHEAFVSQQQRELSKQQLQGAMQQQMHQLFELWNRSPMQAYGASKNPEFASSSSLNATPLVRAGAMLNAVLLTELNSDEQTPVLAQVTTGPFQGARLIGSLSLVGERLSVEFHTLNLPSSTHAITIQALAVDQARAKSSLASYVDRHSWERYASLFGGTIMTLSGYALTLQHRGNYAENLTQNIALPSIGAVSSHVGSELTQKVSQKPTVYVHAGTIIGVLFSSDVIDHASSDV